MKRWLLAAVIAVAPLWAAQSQKISDLPEAGTLTGDELSVVVQGGVTKRTTISALGITDIRKWGAGTDQTAAVNTAAINAALASGAGQVLVPVGTFDISTLNAIPSNVLLSGVSEHLSILRTNSATGDVLTMSGIGTIVDRIRISSSVTRTGGAYVRMTGLNLALENFYFSGAYTAIAVSDGTSITRIFNGLIYDSVGAGQDVVVYGSGTGAGPLAAYMGHVLINSGTPTANNIRIANTGDLLMDNVQSLSATINLLINPASGQNVNSLRAVNSYFDQGVTSMSVVPTGTGIVSRSQFENVWFGSGVGNGAILNGGTGSATIDGIQFVNCQALLSGGSGLALQGRTKNVSWIGGYIAQNLYGVFDSRSAGFDGFILQGATIGAGGGLTQNTAGGIARSGAGNYAIITGNNLVGQVTAPYASANTGANNRVNDNPGYNPIGNSAPTVSASPWTYTAGESRETLYLFGGTISAITVNGTLLFAAAGTPLVIPLGPGDVVATTYSVAPTLNVQRH